MSRKKIRRRKTELNDLLWRRVGELLAARGKRHSELWKRVRRNKNTYTNWIKKRTIPQISDLQELAEALDVSPSDLLRVDGPEVSMKAGGKQTRFEVSCSPAGVTIKKLGNS